MWALARAQASVSAQQGLIRKRICDIYIYIDIYINLFIYLFIDLENAGQSLGKKYIPEFQTPHLEIKNMFQSVGSEILENN